MDNFKRFLFLCWNHIFRFFFFKFSGMLKNQEFQKNNQSSHLILRPYHFIKSVPYNIYGEIFDFIEEN